MDRQLLPHPNPAAPYARAAIADGTVWLCGQVPVDGEGNTPLAIADQVRCVLDNLEAALEAAGASLATLVKLTVFLVDLDEFDEYNAAYIERLRPYGLPPRTTVEVSRMRGPKRIEIDAVARTVR